LLTVSSKFIESCSNASSETTRNAGEIIAMAQQRHVCTNGQRNRSVFRALLKPLTDSIACMSAGR